MCQQHPRQIQRHTQRQNQIQRQEKASKKKVSMYRPTRYREHYICVDNQANDITLHNDKHKDKDIDKDKDRDRDRDKSAEKTQLVLYFRKTEGSRISNMTLMHHQRLISASLVHHPCIISALSVHQQRIISGSTAHHECINSASSVHHQSVISRPQRVGFLDSEQGSSRVVIKNPSTEQSSEQRNQWPTKNI